MTPPGMRDVHGLLVGCAARLRACRATQANSDVDHHGVRRDEPPIAVPRTVQFDHGLHGFERTDSPYPHAGRVSLSARTMDAIANALLIKRSQDSKVTQSFNSKQPKEEAMTAETTCPFSGGAGSHTLSGAPTNAGWWPNQLNLKMLHQQSSKSNPMGEAFNYAEAVQDSRPGCRDQGPHCPDDGLAGLVAGGLRPLRAVLRPHDLARRGYVPHRRWSRRRWHRRAALRPAQQLAGQRQPRQGAPPALADQAEVRPQALLGRPAGARPATSRWIRWASRPSVSAAAARTSGSRRTRSTGVRKPSGWATSATAATVSSPTRSVPCRWA